MLLLFAFTASSQDGLIREVRDELFYNDFNETQTREFYQMVTAIENPSPTILAYQGVAEALIAKIEWNPFYKITRLKKSDNIFKQAIESDPHNLEVRFLRFNTHYYLLSIFSPGDDMAEDKSVIMENLEMLKPEEFDKELIDFIIEFMIESEVCLVEELDMLKSKFKIRQG